MKICPNCKQWTLEPDKQYTHADIELGWDEDSPEIEIQAIPYCCTNCGKHIFIEI